MMVRTFNVLGLLYVGAAFTYRSIRGGYVAISFNLAAWVIYALFIFQFATFRDMQWYVLPTGIYLLSISFFEWYYGYKMIARWIDYLTLTVMVASLLLQVIAYGWWFTVLFWLESIFFFWFGSARRIRHFLYAGVVGFILSTLGQIIHSLESVNLWLVLGGTGILILMLGLFIERKLEDIKSIQRILDDWE